MQSPSTHISNASPAHSPSNAIEQFSSVLAKETPQKTSDGISKAQPKKDKDTREEALAKFTKAAFPDYKGFPSELTPTKPASSPITHCTYPIEPRKEECSKTYVPFSGRTRVIFRGLEMSLSGTSSQVIRCRTAEVLFNQYDKNLRVYTTIRRGEAAYDECMRSNDCIYYEGAVLLPAIVYNTTTTSQKAKIPYTIVKEGNNFTLICPDEIKKDTADKNERITQIGIYSGPMNTLREVINIVQYAPLRDQFIMDLGEE